MSQHFDKTVFGNKSFSDLLEEIYDNQKRREAQVSALISMSLNHWFAILVMLHLLCHLLKNTWNLVLRMMMHLLKWLC